MERQDSNFPDGKESIRRMWAIFAVVVVLLAMSAAAYWMYFNSAGYRVRSILVKVGKHQTDGIDFSGLDESAIPHLLAILQDDDEEKLRGSVPTVFARMGPASTKAVPQLIQLLTHHNPDTRYLAAVSLGGIVPPPMDAIPHLISLLGDTEDSDSGWIAVPTSADPWCSTVGFGAACAIRNIGPPAVPATIQALKHENVHIRAGAAGTLGGMIKSDAKLIISALVVALADEDLRVRTWAVKALDLGGMNTVDELAIPGLIDLLKDTDSTVRSHAAIALTNIGPAAKAAVPDLIRMLKDDQPGISHGFNIVVGDHASWALASIGEAAVPALTEALKDESEQVRKRAAETLEKI